MEAEEAEDIKAAFAEADLDGNGVINFEELCNVFYKLGEWSEEELQEMFAAVDHSGDGKVDYKEFVDWVMAPEEEGEQSMAQDVIDTLNEGAEQNEEGNEGSEHEERNEGSEHEEGEPGQDYDEWGDDYDYEEGDDYDYCSDGEQQRYDDSVYDEEEAEYYDGLEEDVEVDLYEKITRDEFKAIRVILGFSSAEADQIFEDLARQAQEYGASEGPDDGVPVCDVLYDLEIELQDSEMMQKFKEAWDQAKAVAAGEAEMPEEHVESVEAFEGEELDNPSAAASALDRLLAYAQANNLSFTQVFALLENHEVELSHAEEEAIGQVSNVEGKLEQISEKPPVLNSTVGYHSCNEKCIAAVDKIIASCKEEDKKFSDPEWDVVNDPNSVLYVDKQAPGYDCTVSAPSGYKRVTELVEGPVLFKEDAKACDIIQGSIGTCFLLGAMGAMVSHNPNHFKKIFIKYDIEVGVFGVRFCVQGEWKYVIIDDYLPVDGEDSILYARSKDPQEVWVPLLEKAFCKLHTCYEMCDGGWSSEAIASFYGGVNGRLEITDQHREDPSLYFKALQHARKKGYLLCTGFRPPDGEAGAGGGKCGEDVFPFGLVGGHAYSVLRVVEAEGNQLVCCRNPWGNGEWTGKWSDKNEEEEWTDEMKSACNWTDEEDGIFWMSIQDLVTNCDNGGVEYAKTFGPQWKKVTKYAQFQKTGMKAKALVDYSPDAEDEIKFEKDEVIIVKAITEYWWTGKKKDGSEGFFPGQHVKLLKRPISRFDLTITPAAEDKDAKVVVMVMQPNAYFKRKFYKRHEDGLNYKDTSYPSMTIIAVDPDGKKVWKKSEGARCLWGELKVPRGSAATYQVYALCATGSGEKFSIRVYTKNATPELTDSPGATLADVKGVLSAE